MKIIFDSEEQKRRWLNFLSDGCPSSWKVRDHDEHDVCPNPTRAICEKCWADAVEMEVKSDDNRS